MRFFFGQIKHGRQKSVVQQTASEKILFNKQIVTGVDDESNKETIGSCLQESEDDNNKTLKALMKRQKY